MSFYDEDRCTWRHVRYSDLLDRRQAILLIDYMLKMDADAPVPQVTRPSSRPTMKQPFDRAWYLQP